MNIFTRLLLIGLTTFCFSAGVSAATFTVNTTADTADAIAGDGSCADASSNCSFRAAVSEANALAGPDIITLGAVAYSQTLGPRDENSNAGGDWDIKSDITINGVDQATTILQGTGCSGIRDRVLDVGGGITVALNNLTVRSGCQSNVAPFPGGGIFNGGSLTLNNVTVRDNTVQNFEGPAGGGGIYNSGTSLTLNNTTVTNNTVSNGMFGGSAGGGISSFSQGPVIITDSSISGNNANSSSESGLGAGMYAAHVVKLTITNTHFDNNGIQGTANSGGGLYIQGDTADLTAFAKITKCTFNSNTSAGTNASGVGLYVSTAIEQFGRFHVNIDQSTINGNSGSGTGAGLEVFPDAGNIRIDVTNSTISNNISGSTGGGVDMSTVGGELDSEVYSLFTNNTISGNSGTEGGAVSVRATPGNITLQFDYCTLTNNTASSSGGGIRDSSGGGGFLYLQRTVVAGNSAPIGPDISTFSIFSTDYNHIGSPAGFMMTGGTAHNTFGKALLGALQDNGGPTLTHLPSAGSPLVDSIPIGQGTCSTSPFMAKIYGDQRGFGRPFGAGCDRGAVERGATLAAGPWSLSGTIKTTTGIPIRNVAVTISGGNLPAPITVFTGNFGTYQFSNLSGNDYTVLVTAKRYHINDSLVVFSLDHNITDGDFIANAPFSSREVLIPAAVKGKGFR